MPCACARAAIPIDNLVGRYDEEPEDVDEVIYGSSADAVRYAPTPDPLDAIVGSHDIEPVADIDAVIYER